MGTIGESMMKKPSLRRSSWVEDDMVLRMLAVDIVEDSGFKPIEAVSADEAIKVLDRAIYFAIVHRYPDARSMDGLEAGPCRNRRWPHIRVPGVRPIQGDRRG